MSLVMHLAAQPYALIRDGLKTLELRLDDAKRQQLLVGDTISFLPQDFEAPTLETRVVELRRADSFEKLLRDIPMAWLGHAEDERAALLEHLRSYYSAEEEQQLGVLGIRFERRA